MKRIVIDTICTATVREEWVFNIPDDADTDTLLAEGDGLIDALLAEHERYPLHSVKNTDVTDEEDRSITQVGDPR